MDGRSSGVGLYFHGNQNLNESTVDFFQRFKLFNST